MNKTGYELQIGLRSSPYILQNSEYGVLNIYVLQPPWDNFFLWMKRNRLTCSGNPSYESYVEQEAQEREIAVYSRSSFQRPKH